MHSSKKTARKNIASITCLTLALTALPSKAFAAPFTSGNLAILRIDENDSNSPVSIIELHPTTTAQTPSNVIAIDATGANALRLSQTATSTGYLSHTNDFTRISFNGVNTSDTVANVNSLNPRAVGVVNANGDFALATTYTGTLTGNPQTRSSTSLNNSTWYIADQNGIYSNNTTAPSPSGNFRSIKAFGGIAYAFTASASSPPVGVVSAPTGGSFTPLPGLPNGTTAAQDFYLVRSGSNGGAIDVLYVLSATSATVGTIAKFSLVSGTWVSNSSYTTNFGGFGLAAIQGGTGAILYVTSGTGATTANSVRRLADTTGFNAAINIITANNTTLYTAPANTVVKGIDFAPMVPEPSSLTLLGAGLAFGMRRTRRNRTA